ncbi:TonB-dependent siderophore receptor [Nibricoccus aquaticus]|uniref:TonB-dependent siderophore receptor n=1 Tax=Nibricoccus aquaticus TaxID=2576891 RepID=A0A290QBB9_9BACT|nr:TonB-dependent siderophore receptor [Nibricoccus aquaticus]ATC65969.1 TonB-dependent siderophore receptor [Nibricoccus aquaticus]
MKTSFGKFSRPARVVAGSVLVALSAVSALTQETPKGPNAPAASSEGEVIALEKLEVSDSQVGSAPMVASTRLALTIRETPQSISTIGRLRMDEESLFNVNDVLKNVTGVHVSFYDTQRPLYFARGFQITDFQVDGIPTYSGSTNQEYDTALYERIDVIRGANGLTSGAGIPSATINLVRKRAGKAFAASARATVGSWDFYRAETDVNVPLSQDGKFRSRFVVAAQDAESFRDRYAEKKLAWMASVEGDVTATTTLGAGYQYQDNDPTAPMWGTLPRFASDGSELNLPVGTNFSTNWTQWDRTSETAFVTLDQKLGENWNLRAAYNRTEGYVFSLRVYATASGAGQFPNPTTGGGLRLLAGLGETEDVRDNLDVYATGKVELFGRQHDVVLGWNMNNLEAESPSFYSITGGTYLWQYVIPDYRTYDGNAPMPTVLKTGGKQVATTDQSGFYASLRYRVMDPLSVIVGARLSSWETRTDVYAPSGARSATGAYEVNDEVTPYLGVVYDINAVWSAYASYTDVFRPQSNKDRNGDLLKPVLGSNVEGGLKAEFFAKRFQVSFGVFETKQDNYAVRDGTLKIPDGTADAYIGVDGTKSSGVEFEMSGYILPEWTANLGYTNVNTRRHPLDLTYANVPEHLIQFSTNYRLPGAWKKLSVGAGANWQGKATGYGINHPLLGTTTAEQASFALINVFANYRFTDHLTATLSVRNATDYQYWATLDYPNYGEPRNVTATLRWSY